MSGGRLQEIKALAQAHIGDIAREFVPDGRRSGAYWIGRNPTRNDEHAGSFWIRLHGPPGVWRDEATGDTGDVLELIRYCAQLPDIPAALRWCEDFLRLGSMTAADRERRARQTRERVAREDAAQTAAAAENRDRARAVYLASRRRPLLGSPADVYLKTRGIDLSRLERVPGSLGWLPDGRHSESQTEWPVMVAAFVGDDNQVAAVHRTFLERDGSGKAPVAPQRKIWPSPAGSAVRLWRGETMLSQDAAAKQGIRETLLICEGIEDGLSLALACPEHRIWCAGTLGNMTTLTLPECIDSVVLCADNDWGKPQAAQLFGRAVRHFSQQGRRVAVARSHVGKDVNDALRGQ